MKRNTFLKSLGLLAVGIISGKNIFGAVKKDELPNYDLDPEISRKLNDDMVDYGGCVYKGYSDGKIEYVPYIEYQRGNLKWQNNELFTKVVW